MRRFLHRLALKMGRTVRELMEEMGADELRDWMAYSELEPWGEERDDLRSASIVATILNLFRGEDQAVNPVDLLPDFAGDRDQKKRGRVIDLTKMSKSEQREMAQAMAAGLGWR